MTVSIKQSGARRFPPRVVIYGPPKVGKTTFAASSRSPLFLPTEDGLGTLDVPMVTGLGGRLVSWADMIEAIHIAGASDAKTIVLDSVTAAQDLCFASVAQDERVPSIAHVPYGKGYPRALSRWLAMLGHLDTLRIAGKLVILIGHSQTESYADPEGESYDRHVLRLHQQAEGKPSLRAATMEWADIVGFAAIRVLRKTAGEGFRERTLAVGNERVLYTSPSPARAAGSRLPLPPEMPLDWAIFAGHLRAAYAQPTPEPIPEQTEAAAVATATEEKDSTQ